MPRYSLLHRRWLQLIIYSPPGSVAAAGTGIFAGILYRSDFVGLKRYRLSGPLQSFSSKFLLPLIGSTQVSRRHNRALPDEMNWSAGRDVVTTASRSAQAQSSPSQNSNLLSVMSPVDRAENAPRNAEAAGINRDSPAPRTSSVLNQWVDELTGRGRASGMRVPTNAEIGQLALVFPDAPRDAIVTALQRRSAFPLPVIWRAPD
jgi:ubiquitin-associated domain-containing protein 2